MGTMTIDGRKVEFTDEKNVLTVIRNAGIDIPTLCYHSELSTFGACRLCTVEDDRGKTFASCSEVPRDGMVIHTNTNKLRNYRKLIDPETCRKRYSSPSNPQYLWDRRKTSERISGTDSAGWMYLRICQYSGAGCDPATWKNSPCCLRCEKTGRRDGKDA